MEFKIVRTVSLMLVLIFCFFTFSCTKENTEDEFIDEPVTLNMNTEYKLAKNLPNGEGKRVKVILLLGQSNASGSSIVSYLEKKFFYRGLCTLQRRIFVRFDQLLYR